MNFKRLLAKRSRSPDSPEDRETLAYHLGDVIMAADAILEVVGRRIAESLGLSPSSHGVLNDAVRRAAFLHDLGKANDEFQRMLRSGPPLQALRHEWISTWLPFRFPLLDDWLFEGCSPDVRWATLFSVVGHHLQVADLADLRPRPGGGSSRMLFLGDHRDVKACLQVARQRLGLPHPPSLERVEIDLVDDALSDLRAALQDAPDGDNETKRLVAAVKATVIAADVAGSAVPKKGICLDRWTTEVLSHACTAADLQRVAEIQLDGRRPRPFQERLAATQSLVTFVKAGCGSGKTVGAYLWASRWADGRKLFFCYPTTGTATEGYRDYIVPSDLEPEAALLHSRSEVDLEDLIGREDDDLADGQPDAAPAIDRAVRIESLLAWDVRLVVSTADQVLGLAQNGRRPLFSFPAIANGAFVFDEIHQYDEFLFGALLRFLDAFRGAPVLLMTASLQPNRRRALEDAVRGTDRELAVIEGPSDLERLSRYLLHEPVSAPPWDVVGEALANRGKVLWVANTVDRAVGFAQEAERRGLVPALPYHSRYRYCDRVACHRAVVDAFRSEHPGPALAITTQVCEVSLNLSADLLVSDLAPVPALVQRLGRLNRRVTVERPGQPAPAFFLTPPGTAPYAKAMFDPAAVRDWCAKLSGHPVCQEDLARAFEDMAEGPPSSLVRSAWLDGGPLSAVAPLRDADATIPIVREEDAGHCADSRGRPIAKEIARFAIPMTLGPVAKHLRSWKRLGFAFVAPRGTIDYSERWGARWALA
jgi:CRISPR-associated endonuclease/helicase Cas3